MNKRFEFSLFRNATLKEKHRSEWLPVGSTQNANSEYTATMQTDSNGRVFVASLGGGGIHVVGNGTNANNVVNSIGGSVSDFDVRGDILAAVGGNMVRIIAMPSSFSADSISNNSAVVGSAGFETAAHLVLLNRVAPIAAVATVSAAVFVDAATTKEIVSLAHPSTLQSLAWSAQGSTLAATAKDNIVRLFDPRAARSNSVDAAVLISQVHHAGVKPSKIVPLSDASYFLSTGFSKSRDRELALWDVRNFKSPTFSLKVDSSTGLLIPLLDVDSGLLFLAGKGETTIRTFEVTTSNITQTLTNFITSVPVISACLMHKLAVDVMDCEVARIMALATAGTSETIVPISATVMRKNKIDFQEDLFPPTFSDIIVISAQEWLNRKDTPPAKVSLNPRAKTIPTVSTSTLSAVPPKLVPIPTAIAIESSTPYVTSQAKPTLGPSTPTQTPLPQKTASASPQLSSSLNQTPFSSSPQTIPSSPKATIIDSPAPSQKTKSRSTPPKIATQSSFNYISGVPTKHFDNLKTQPPTLASECRLFDANFAYAAWPVPGSGGRVTFWPHSRTGRLPAVRVPCVIPSRDLSDFYLSRRSENTLYTLSDDGVLRTWVLPVPEDFPFDNGKGMDDLTVPVAAVKVNAGKSGFMAVHPSISGLVVVASAEPANAALRCWDIGNGGDGASEPALLWSLRYPDLIFGSSFSYCGGRIVTVCKNGDVQIVDLKTGIVVAETKFGGGGFGEIGGKGARVAWIGQTEFFLTCTFGKANQREMRIYNSKNLSQTTLVTTEMSPSLITPHVDESLPIVYLVGKGESYIQIFYIDLPPTDSAQSIKCIKLLNYVSSTAQVGTAFLPKNVCDVKEVEIAKCYRLTATSVEQVSFKVPRLKKEFFQDDIFPPLVEPIIVSVTQWRQSSGDKKLETRVVDLCPAEMEPVSSVRVATTITQRSSTTVAVELSEAQKKAVAMEQMKRLALADESGGVVQDKFQGVDDDEWDD
ncbi:Coronin-7 [Physocladia obscura]|uniref:Coronin-7 n=1 Tax=Physocladia obscura TaxID=109957 RepID=A0AAD5T0Z6_9FUNG|nr:Coronin-7 [Physocladia obscura]